MSYVACVHRPDQRIPNIEPCIECENGEKICSISPAPHRAHQCVDGADNIFWCHGINVETFTIDDVAKLREIHAWLAEIMPTVRIAMKMLEAKNKVMSWGFGGKRN